MELLYKREDVRCHGQQKQSGGNSGSENAAATSQVSFLMGGTVCCFSR